MVKGRVKGTFLPAWEEVERLPLQDLESSCVHNRCA